MTYRSRLAIVALAALAVGRAGAAPAVGAGARPITPATPQERTLVNPDSVLVFPFDKAPQPNAPASLGASIGVHIRAGFNASGKYSAANFYAVSPLVQRAAAQQGLLSPQDLDTVIDRERGVVDQDKALRVAAAVGVASTVLGSIEDYRYDTQSKQASITVTAQWLQVPGGTPIKTVGLTGTGTGATEQEAAMAAARDAGQKVVANLGIPPPPPPVVVPAGKKKPVAQSVTPTGRRNGWLAWTMVLGVLAAAVK